MKDKEEMRIEEMVEEVCERHAFRERVEELGYSLSDEDFNHAFIAFKRHGDK